MSGIEIVGLILGAISVLIEALDVYKGGLARIGTGFRKRKYVEKLCRALRLHKDTLEELMTSVLVSSGCEPLSASKTEVQVYLEDADVQLEVAEHLGQQKHDTLMGAMRDCEGIFQSLATKIAGLVPSIRGSTDLIKIVEHNQSASRSRADIFTKIKLVFSSKDIEDEVRKLDASIATLERFLRVTLGNRQEVGELPPSRKTMRLARAMRRIRDHADDLYFAMACKWAQGCHDSHGAKLFLEDRVDDVTTTMRLGSNPRGTKLQFEMVLIGTDNLCDNMWRTVEVIVIEQDTGGTSPIDPPTKPTRIQIIVPPSSDPGLFKSKPIADLCSAVQEAKTRQQQLRLGLSVGRHLAGISSPKPSDDCQHSPKSITLRELLYKGVSQRTIGGSTIPLMLKLDLALKLASASLQLLNTPWMRSSLSSDVIHFALDQDSKPVNLKKPMVTCSFDISTKSTPSPCIDSSVRRILLELGSMLLELWHEQSLDQKYNSQSLTTSERQAQALDWLHEEAGVLNPLPNSYYAAVQRCVTSVLDQGQRLPEWQNVELWRAVCAGIIDPLSKLAKL